MLYYWNFSILFKFGGFIKYAKYNAYWLNSLWVVVYSLWGAQNVKGCGFDFTRGYEIFDIFISYCGNEGEKKSEAFSKILWKMGTEWTLDFQVPFAYPAMMSMCGISYEVKKKKCHWHKLSS